MDILDRLLKYCGEDYVPMHMPGAKRNTKLFEMDNPYGLDITEITGFDNMHHADGIIKGAFDRAADVFGADETLFLVNGSSAGILSAICGATKKRDTVLVSRNCHVSVYNAMYLNELNPIYLYPKPYNCRLCQADTEGLNMKSDKISFSHNKTDINDEQKYNQLTNQNTYGHNKADINDEQKYNQFINQNTDGCNKTDGNDKSKYIEHYNKRITDNINAAGIYGEVSVNDIEIELKAHSEISAVIITSPTYEGVVSDIRAIADVVHKYGKVLIVDEAHGAHFNFHNEFPESAIKLGADIVIQSIHKTLPSFTQTALLHLNGNRIDRDRVKFYWNIYQSTSPSYILMAGIDRCITIIEKNGHELFDSYVRNLKQLRWRLSKLNNMYLLPVDDISKIVLIADDGRKLQNLLFDKYHIELEMSSLKYIIAMTSIGDTVEYYERFARALEEIDKDYYKYFNKNCICEKSGYYEEICKDSTEDGKIKEKNKLHITLSRVKVKLNIYDTLSENSKKRADVRLVSGKIAAQMVCFYPPGIPLINPGEEYTKEIIDNIIAGVNSGLEVIGVEMAADEAGTGREIFVNIYNNK